MMYNLLVEDCFFRPRHHGCLVNTALESVKIKNGRLDQAGIIELILGYDQQAVIQEVRFRAAGHPYLIAGLEWLCRQLEGASLNAVPTITSRQLIEVMEIPKLQQGIALRIEDIYSQLIELARINRAEKSI